MPGFEELVAWQEAVSLSANILQIAPHVGGLEASTVVKQMIRAADSIHANIAEGYGRGVNRDCLRFLRIARASTSELESHLRAAQRTGRLTSAAVEPLIDQTIRVRFLIGRFAASVERRMQR